MAGDWIKFEHATPDKPEVHRIADLLGVNADEAVGIVARFWIWLDKNSCNGSVTHVYAKPLESMMRCPGFVAAMVDVGWVELDEKTGKISIPHHERHNGSPAKSRALTRDRVKRTRNDHVTQTPLPEKRREEKILKTLNPIANSAAPNVAEACQVLEFLNLKTGRHFRATPKTIEPIVRRIKEGATVGECKAVVMHRWRMWKDDDKQRDWLRPSTLFSASHFANYLGDVPQAEDLIRGD